MRTLILSANKMLSFVQYNSSMKGSSTQMSKAFGASIGLQQTNKISLRVCAFSFFFSSRRRHTRCSRDWSSDVCSSDLIEEGAFGLSTGLFYVPGSFAKTEEVIELSRVVRAMGGYYDSHMRDEDSYSIEIGRASCRERV